MLPLAADWISRSTTLTVATAIQGETNLKVLAASVVQIILKIDLDPLFLVVDGDASNEVLAMLILDSGDAVVFGGDGSFATTIT